MAVFFSKYYSAKVAVFFSKYYSAKVAVVVFLFFKLVNFFFVQSECVCIYIYICVGVSE